MLMASNFQTSMVVWVMAIAGLAHGAGEPTLRPEPTAATTPANDAADGAEATSLLGKTLSAPLLDDARRAVLEDDARKARAEFDANPKSEASAIWFGRRLASLGKYRDAVNVFAFGLRANPESYRLLRHRGHRWITLREFDKAIADLSEAARLSEGKTDEPERDPLANTQQNEPRSTDKSNIYYHLGLAYYFKGEWERALAAFGRRNEIASNDDLTVASVHWEYLSLRRLGRHEEAKARLSVIRPFMDVRENDAYYNLCRMYLGDIRTEQISHMASPGASTHLMLLYGLAAFTQAEGDTAGARKIFEQVGTSDNWPAFGVIASEVELARVKTSAGVVSGE
jgi:tetratricopeptide (TPR) repeat protein